MTGLGRLIANAQDWLNRPRVTRTHLAAVALSTLDELAALAARCAALEEKVALLEQRAEYEREVRAGDDW